MSSVRVNRPARQYHAGSPIQPPSPPGGGADPGRIVAVGSGEDCVVRPFLLCPPLTHDDPLEAYDTLVKEECGSDAQPSPLGLAAAAAVARYRPDKVVEVIPTEDVPPHDSHKLILPQQQRTIPTPRPIGGTPGKMSLTPLHNLYQKSRGGVIPGKVLSHPGSLGQGGLLERGDWPRNPTNTHIHTHTP